MSVLLEKPSTLPFDFFESEKEDRDNVLDESSEDDTVAPEQYDITSYGADYDVEGLVKRITRGDIYIPPFQRDYVWAQPMASRFIESLLLGLPVPGIFLARESSNRQIVIDGQQRLKTLKYFYEGVFNPKPDDKTNRIFKLLKVQPQYEGRTYATLNEQDRIKLNDSIIHATVVKQESPEDGDTSLYHIYERLNNGGLKMAPQEIRTAIYHGDLIDLVKKLNDDEKWRSIYGKKSLRLKDEELILRFLALYYSADTYQQPMEEFLNKFAKKYSRASETFLENAEQLFKNTINTVISNIGEKSFRPERALNAAVFDSVMVGISKKLGQKSSPISPPIALAYEKLIKEEHYLKLISRATSDENNVKDRLQKATHAFASL